MRQINASSSQQSLGVAEVGEAVTLMDQTIQQNAELVEQMAAAAASLNALSNDMVQTLAIFHLPGDTAGNSDRKAFKMLARLR
jgi:methyl-accepting chemotaxis protein